MSAVPPKMTQWGGFTEIFIRRPVLALVVSMLLVVAGFSSLSNIEVRELPAIDRPVISITTAFTGATPETVDRELTNVIEGSVARVSGIRNIASSSSFGRSRVTLEFSADTDLDVAANDLRDAISRISNRLPAEASEPRLVKSDADAQPVLRLSLTDENRSVQELTIILEQLVLDRLAAVAGVADVQAFGTRNQVFLVDLNPQRLAAYGLMVSDVRQALRSVSFDVPAGGLTSQEQKLIVRASSLLNDVEGFSRLPIKEGVTLADVATVSLGNNPADSILRTNGRVGVGAGVIRQAQANTLQISNGIRVAVESLQPLLPDGTVLRISSDDATFIRGSIAEAVKTLAYAIGIVIAIIFVFLRDWRATLIPAITIPVSLIGTLAAVYLAGFSINILTLLALVLATGLVVDDTIVVLENIVRHRRQGMGSRAAAIVGVRQVFFAVVSTTATLAAVFIPLSFLPGPAGGLFREFGFTLALAVILSSFVALTLVPMLSSRLLSINTSSRADTNALATANLLQPTLMSRVDELLASLYRTLLRHALAAPWVVLTLSFAVAALAGSLWGSVDRALTPPEDRSVALLSVSAPQGVSLAYTQRQIDRIEQLIQPLRDSGEIENTFAITGLGGSTNRSFMVMTLAPKQLRDRSQLEIVGQINGLLRTVPGVQAFAIQPNSLGIRGGGQGLRFALMGDNFDRLGEQAQLMVDALNDDGRFGRVRLSFETTQPQLNLNIDRQRANELGIDLTALTASLQAVLEGSSAGSVFIEDRSVDIILLSTTFPIRDPSDLENILVRAQGGVMVPMSSIVTLQEQAVSPSLNRVQQMRSVSISASLSDGFALGDAWQAAQSLAAPFQADNMTLLPLGEAATLSETNASLLLTFALALLVVYLVLAAQFESFISAWVVIFTVPFGLACAVFALLMSGVSLNIYSQIGLVLLVGIMAKNGILMVEFANQLRDLGRSVPEAIYEAAVIRLKPVVMTMSSTVLGGVPLIFAVGAGSEAREALGWVIVLGLGLAAVFTLFLTPVAYLLIARFSSSSIEEINIINNELEQVPDNLV